MKKETTTLPRKTSLAARRWYLVDAQGKTVGRLASTIASVLRGKHNPTFSPHIDNGDFVVVVNANQVRFSGNKLRQKIYYWHTEYPGGIRETSAGRLLETRPEAILKKAVVGMLPKTPFGRGLASKLKIYAGPDHPHAAQQPVELLRGE
jgi:large subunit ribosomal protein L13